MLVPYKLSNAVSQLASIYNITEIFNHGCWCSKLAHHSRPGLGGRDSVDDLDEICKKWAKARRCLRTSGQSCEFTHLESLRKDYEYENCSGNSDDACLTETCEIDNFFMENIQIWNEENSEFIPENDPECFERVGVGAGNSKCEVFTTGWFLKMYGS